MERTLRLKNLLARSASDFLWFESLFKEKVEYLDAFRDLLNTRQWVRDVAANSNTMNMISKSQMLMREVAANDGAMAILLGTPESLQITVSSATAMSAVWNNQAAWGKVSESDMAVAKYVIGCAGQDPAKFSNMGAVAASATAMGAVAASATAMGAVAKSAQACQLIESPLQNHRTALHNTLNKAPSVFRKTTSTIGNGAGTRDEGANTSTIYIPTFCSDDGDTDYDVKSLLAGNKQIVRINRHSGNAAVTTGAALRGVRVVGSGSSSGNVTFDIFTVI